MTAPAPAWLIPTSADPAVLSVSGWLELAAPTAAQSALLAACAAAVEPQVQRRRPDMWAGDVAVAPLVYTPDAEVYQAAVMLAARLYRRRNSPAGIESFSESLGAVFTSKYDPEIERALRTGSWATPRIG